MEQTGQNRSLIIGPIHWHNYLRITGIGLGIGLFLSLSAWAFNSAVFGPLLCEEDICGVGTGFAWGTASVIAMVIGLYACVVTRVYRPLLVVLLATILLLILLPSLSQSSLLVDTLVASVVAALSYVLLAMTARVRSFYGSVGAGLAIVLAGYLAAYL